jgi:hypothetical protein
MTTSLVRIERRLPPAVVASLAPPATLADLDRVAGIIGTGLPPDLKRLYLWHNGTTGYGDRFEIAPGFFFEPLDKAVEHWRFLDDANAGELAADPEFRYWQRHWFPIADDTCGDHVIVETAGEHQRRVVPTMCGNGPQPERGWPSLAAWADQFLASLTPAADRDGVSDIVSGRSAERGD